MSQRRSRSRSPLSVSSTSDGDSKTKNKSSRNWKQNELKCKILFLSNTPAMWNWDDCRNFISQQVSSDLKSYLPFTSAYKNGFLLKFASTTECTKFYRELIGRTIQGKPIKLIQFDNNFAEIPKKSIKPDRPRKLKIEDSTTLNPNETYGLSLDFLNKLEISLPLKRYIFVQNLALDTTKEMVKELFSLAGEIVQVTVIKRNNKTLAKIAYDHPVEAVQAISMFDGQKWFDRTMVVQFDNRPQPHLLPEGLESIGLGLGTNGEPLRGISYMTQMELLKQFITQEIERLKNVSSTNPSSAMVIDNTMMSAMPTFVRPWNVNPINTVQMAPIQATPFYGMNLQQSGWRELLQQNNENDVTSKVAAYQTQSNVNNLTGTTQMVMDQQYSTSKMSPDTEENQMTSDLVVFKNLPSSVTAHALKKKMNEVGNLILAEMTGEGRAIVRFQDNRDAIHCIKLFDQTKVDGQRIDVKFL
ncbi:hypothetical protein ACJJTC_017291 [Scirpophaga incertulas]